MSAMEYKGFVSYGWLYFEYLNLWFWWIQHFTRASMIFSVNTHRFFFPTRSKYLVHTVNIIRDYLGMCLMHKFFYAEKKWHNCLLSIIYILYIYVYSIYIYILCNLPIKKVYNSVYFSIFVRLFNQHHYLIPGHFHYATMIPHNR